jgi:mannose-6-phosphate isomerase-like protein (cupin superfamily)
MVREAGFALDGDGHLKETRLPARPDAKSPAGADIRFIMDGPRGNMIHSTVPPGQINRATVHATVSEFWFVLEGQGEIWRKDEGEERVTPLQAGVSIDIPVGTAFQYRNVADGPLTFICISMPPWPGDSEATHLAGIWPPTI